MYRQAASYHAVVPIVELAVVVAAGGIKGIKGGLVGRGLGTNDVVDLLVVDLVVAVVVDVAIVVDVVNVDE